MEHATCDIFLHGYCTVGTVHHLLLLCLPTSFPHCLFHVSLPLSTNPAQALKKGFLSLREGVCVGGTTSYVMYRTVPVPPTPGPHPRGTPSLSLFLSLCSLVPIT